MKIEEGPLENQADRQSTYKWFFDNNFMSWGHSQITYLFLQNYIFIYNKFLLFIYNRRNVEVI